MPRQTTIVWKVTSLFDNAHLTSVLEKFKAAPLKTTNQYQTATWKVDGLTINLYQKSLVIQGIVSDHTKSLLQEISSLDGLTLDDANAEIFAQLFPRIQNAIACPECRQQSFVIEGRLDGLDVSFKRECNHVDKIRPPLIMLNSRVLLDINVLVAKAMSRLVNLGFFVGFEVVIPQYIMSLMDNYVGPREKAAMSDEITFLRNLGSKGKIEILNYQDNLKIPSDKEAFQLEEDDAILKIAHLTNSVLVTCDKNLKDKAALAKRPVIYIPASILGSLKILEEVRSPE